MPSVDKGTIAQQVPLADVTPPEVLHLLLRCEQGHEETIPPGPVLLADTAEKEDLLRQAEENGAEPAVMEVLEALEEGPYESMADVMSAYGDAAAEARGEGSDEDDDEER